MSSFLSAGPSASQSMAEGYAQSSMYSRQAEAAMMEAGLQREEITREEEELKGRQRALYAKAGVDISEGSPLLVMEETAKRAELARERTTWEAQNKYRQLKWAGKMARKGGQMGAIAQGINVLGTAAGLAIGGLTTGGLTTATTPSGMTGAGVGSGLNWSWSSFLRNLYR
jgi:hypothetical protein